MLYDLFRYDEFLDNKYTKWYYNIIRSARSVMPTGYTEVHHIIPKCLDNGTDDDVNLVRLSAREHYICHLLLTRMTTGQTKQKMCYALWSMMGRNSNKMQRDYTVHSKIYAAVREERRTYFARPIAEKYGIERADLIRKKQSTNHRGHNTDATKERISQSIVSKNERWYTNGTVAKKFAEGAQPDEWVRGRTKYLKNTWRWYNNGTETKRMIEGTQPSGWVLGRPFLLGIGKS